MKKLLLSASVVAGLFAAPSIDSLQKQINDLQQQLKELKAKQASQNDRYYKKVAPVVANSHLFWSYDLRTSYDWISKETTGGMKYSVQMNMGQYSPLFLKQGFIDKNNQMFGSIYGKYANLKNGLSENSQFAMYVPLENQQIPGMPAGTKYSLPSTSQGKTYHGRIFSNRIILTGVYKPNDALKTTVKIEANKVFGFSNINSMQEPFENVDWVANETPDDANIRIKEAFFNYYFGDDLMFSAGRRPATNGYPANLRENDNPASPLAHLINMEFDGFSFQIGNGEFSKLSDKFSDLGVWMKFCFGRGYSNTNGKWSFTSNPDYTADNNLKDSDFAGFILVPYDDGQYSLWTETVWAFNLRGFRPTGETAVIDDDANVSNGFNAFVMGYNMPVVGNYFGENIVFKADGIGDGINDFLDDTKAFVSFAYSQTRPKAGQSMLGSNKNKSGHSIWIGADMPAGDDGRFGVSYIKGSKYWRNFTYGEDTLAGSIAAVRGHAFDVYYNGQIIPHLTWGLRYTYISYDYPGSDAFFGDMGDPSTTNAFSYPINYVKTAKDLRAYIRYNF